MCAFYEEKKNYFAEVENKKREILTKKKNLKTAGWVEWTKSERNFLVFFFINILTFFLHL